MTVLGAISGCIFVAIVRVILFVVTCGRVKLCPHKNHVVVPSHATGNYAMHVVAHSGAYTAVPTEADKEKKVETV